MRPSKRPNSFTVVWDHEKKQLRMTVYGTLAVLAVSIGAAVALAVIKLLT